MAALLVLLPDRVHLSLLARPRSFPRESSLPLLPTDLRPSDFFRPHCFYNLSVVSYRTLRVRYEKRDDRVEPILGTDGFNVV